MSIAESIKLNNCNFKYKFTLRGKMHIVGCFIINADLKVVYVEVIIDLYSYYGLPRKSKASSKISCSYIYI